MLISPIKIDHNIGMIFISRISQQIISQENLKRFRGHIHSELYEIIIPLSGVVGVKIAEKDDLFLKPREALFLPKNEFHWMWAAGNNTTYYNSYFRGDLPQLNKLCSRNLCSNLDDWREDPFWLEIGDADQEELMAKTLQLISFCSHSKGGLKERENDSFPSLEDSFRSTLIDLIETEPGINHGLNEIAERFFLEPHYLSSKVKKSTGKTIMELYYQEKINKAKSLLQSGISVKDTAFSLGFSNPYHFSRKFKQITGYSPSRELEK